MIPAIAAESMLCLNKAASPIIMKISENNVMIIGIITFIFLYLKKITIHTAINAARPAISAFLKKDSPNTGLIDFSSIISRLVGREPVNNIV